MLNKQLPENRQRNIARNEAEIDRRLRLIENDGFDFAEPYAAETDESGPVGYGPLIVPWDDTEEFK